MERKWQIKDFFIFGHTTSRESDRFVGWVECDSLSQRNQDCKITLLSMVKNSHDNSWEVSIGEEHEFC